MRYETIHLDIWNDSWQCSMTAHERLVWLALLTHPDMTIPGIFKLSVFALSEMVKLPAEEVDLILEKFQVDSRIYYDRSRQKVFLINKFGYRLSTQGNLSPNQQENLRSILHDVRESEILPLFVTRYKAHPVVKRVCQGVAHGVDYRVFNGHGHGVGKRDGEGLPMELTTSRVRDHNGSESGSENENEKRNLNTPIASVAPAEAEPPGVPKEKSQESGNPGSPSFRGAQEPRTGQSPSTELADRIRSKAQSSPPAGGWKETQRQEPKKTAPGGNPHAMDKSELQRVYDRLAEKFIMTFDEKLAAQAHFLAWLKGPIGIGATRETILAQAESSFSAFAPSREQLAAEHALPPEQPETQAQTGAGEHQALEFPKISRQEAERLDREFHARGADLSFVHAQYEDWFNRNHGLPRQVCEDTLASLVKDALAQTEYLETTHGLPSVEAAAGQGETFTAAPASIEALKDKARQALEASLGESTPHFAQEGA